MLVYAPNPAVLAMMRQALKLHTIRPVLLISREWFYFIGLIVSGLRCRLPADFSGFRCIVRLSCLILATPRNRNVPALIASPVEMGGATRAGTCIWAAVYLTYIIVASRYTGAIPARANGWQRPDRPHSAAPYTDRRGHWPHPSAGFGGRPAAGRPTELPRAGPGGRTR